LFLEAEMEESVSEEKPGPIAHFIVDGVEQSSTSEEMTPTQILNGAGINPDTHALAKVTRGRVARCGDQPIRVDGMEFVSVPK
jgi:hypothetical protein